MISHKIDFDFDISQKHTEMSPPPPHPNVAQRGPQPRADPLQHQRVPVPLILTLSNECCAPAGAAPIAPQSELAKRASPFCAALTSMITSVKWPTGATT